MARAAGPAVNGSRKEAEPERDAKDGTESTWATTSPEVTCRARAPSARMSAEECRASSTVAQVVNRAFRTARVTRMTVMTVSICSSRLITGSDNPVTVTTDEPESRPSA
jgi:hypothetical protein